jgi:hypothetical protein
MTAAWYVIDSLRHNLAKVHEVLLQRSRELEQRSWYRAMVWHQVRPVYSEPMAELEGCVAAAELE